MQHFWVLVLHLRVDATTARGVNELVTSFFIAHVIPLGEAGGDGNKQTVSIASDDAESASTMTF